MKLSVSRSVSTESVGTDAIINASVIIDPTNLPPQDGENRDPSDESGGDGLEAG